MSTTRLLLICGIVASVLQIAMDIVAGTWFYPGYDFTSQQVSELSAIGAPSRDFWMAMGYLYALLMVAFTAGVWRAASGQVALRIAAVSIGLFALNSFLWGHLAPMHMRGTEFTSTDTMHIAFAGSAVLLIIAFITSGAVALERSFRLYSALTLGAVLAAGGIVGTQVSAIAAGLPTPWMGLLERVSVYGPMIWLAAFAVFLLRRSERAAHVGRGGFPAAGRAGA